jgi:hypothetical protein
VGTSSPGPALPADRRRDRAERTGCARRRPNLGGCARRQRSTHGRGHEQRPDEMRAAPIVLLPRPLAVLFVGADGDVLRAVVGGEITTAERHRGRRKGDEARQELAGRRAQPGRRPKAAGRDGTGDHRGDNGRPLEGEPRLG